MEHFARWVVRHLKAVLAAAVLLLIPSVFGAAGTYINYDILTYLPPEFRPGGRISGVTISNMLQFTPTVRICPLRTPLALKSELEAVAGVKSVLWTSDILDVTTPKEMLPADIQKFFFTAKTCATLLLVQFKTQAPMP